MVMVVMIAVTAVTATTVREGADVDNGRCGRPAGAGGSWSSLWHSEKVVHLHIKVDSAPAPSASTFATHDAVHGHQDILAV